MVCLARHFSLFAQGGTLTTDFQFVFNTVHDYSPCCWLARLTAVCTCGNETVCVCVCIFIFTRTCVCLEVCECVGDCMCAVFVSVFVCAHQYVGKREMTVFVHRALVRTRRKSVFQRADNSSS